MSRMPDFAAFSIRRLLWVAGFTLTLASVQGAGTPIQRAEPAPDAVSGLRWAETDVVVRADPMAESVEAAFTFTNTAQVPVTIATVHSSCGCTVPELKKNTYAPGETGSIRAVFTIGERTGPQEKMITVMTAAPDSTTTSLTLRVDIPKLYEVAPYFVIWNSGEPATEKKIDLRLLAPELLSVKSVESRHTSFTAAIAPVGDGVGHFTVSIKPTTTDAVTNGAVIVTLATPQGQTRSVNLYALVRGSPQAKTPLPPSAQAPSGAEVDR